MYVRTTNLCLYLCVYAMPAASTCILRCNSTVYHTTDLKTTTSTKVEPGRTARQAAPSLGDDGRGAGDPSTVFTSNPAATKESRSPTGKCSRTALLSRLNSPVASASSQTHHHQDQFVRKRYAKINARMGSEERHTERRPHGSPTASAPELAMSDGGGGSRGRASDERIPPRRGVEISTTPRRSLRCDGGLRRLVFLVMSCIGRFSREEKNVAQSKSVRGSQLLDFQGVLVFKYRTFQNHGS